jgi:hypothetical protein
MHFSTSGAASPLEIPAPQAQRTAPIKPCCEAVLSGPANGAQRRRKPAKQKEQQRDRRRGIGRKGIGGEGAAIVARAVPMASPSLCAPPPMVADGSTSLPPCLHPPIPQLHPRDQQAICRGSGDVVRQRPALLAPRYVDLASLAAMQ